MCNLMLLSKVMNICQADSSLPLFISVLYYFFTVLPLLVLGEINVYIYTAGILS